MRRLARRDHTRGHNEEQRYFFPNRHDTDFLIGGGGVRLEILTPMSYGGGALTC